jgi:Phospholipase_D-nuclease N-terminal
MRVPCRKQNSYFSLLISAMRRRRARSTVWQRGAPNGCNNLRKEPHMRMIPIVLLIAAAPFLIVAFILWLSGVLGFSVFALLVAIGLFVIWLMALVDVVRRGDLTGGAKVVWALVMLFLPIFGLLAYVVARPPSGDVTYGGEVLG